MNTHTQDQIRQMFDWWTVNVIHMNWSLVSVMIVFSRTLVLDTGGSWDCLHPQGSMSCSILEDVMQDTTSLAAAPLQLSCTSSMFDFLHLRCLQCAVHWPPNNHQDWGYWTLISASTPLHQYDELFLAKVQMKSFNLLNFLAVQYLLFYFYIHVTSLFIITINACDAIVSKRKAYQTTEPNASKLYAV